MVFQPSGFPQLGSSILGGAGWAGSTSLVDYPKTGPVTGGGVIVDIDDGAGGKTPAQRLADALALLSTNNRVLVRNNSDATVVLTSRITRSVAWGVLKEFFAYGNQRIRIDASNLGALNTILFSGANREHWKGFDISGSAYSGGHVILADASSNLKLEDFWIHDNPGNDGRAPTGVALWGGADNVVQDVIVWNSVVGGGTNSGDGFQGTVFTLRARFVRCFVSHSGDDGYDMFHASETHVLDSIAVSAAMNLNGTPNTGNGNGFKMGNTDNTNPSNNKLIGSIALFNRDDGADWNVQPGRIDYVHNTMYSNGRYGLVAATNESVVTDNIAWANAGSGGNGVQYTNSTPDTILRNSWQLENTNPMFFNPTTGDFSLNSTSPYLTDGAGGTPLGASTVALALLKENWSRR